MASQTKQRFEEVAMPHLNVVYGMARRLGTNEAEAEDLVQETFMRAYRSFATFELRDYGAKPWLLKILHNVFYTQRSREHRQPSLLDDVDFDRFAGELDTTPLDVLFDGEVDWDHFDDELKVAVESLQPEYRSVLLLWALGDMSYREIAVACDCPIGTVMSRLYRARQQLGRVLAEYAAERNLGTERFDR